MGAHKINSKTDSLAAPLAQFEPSADAVTRKVLLTALTIEVLLVVLDLTVNHLEWIPFSPMQRLFNMAREDSLSAWLSSAQTLLAGLVLTAIWLITKSQGQERSRIRGWGIMACCFIYLAVDDGAGVHERVGSSFKQLKEMLGETGSIYPSYDWQVVLGPVFGVMGLFMLNFLRRELHSKSLRILVLAAFACYGAAVGMDFIEGLPSGSGYDGIAGFLGANEKSLRHFGKVTEEFLEHLGTTFFLVTFLKYLLMMTKRIRIESTNIS